MGETFYLAMRQPADDKKINVTGWGWFPDWESWTWPGQKGKPIEVEVYSRHLCVANYRSGSDRGLI
jgi:beta-galactosidase